MTQHNYSRFSGIISIETANNIPVFVLGAGAIGSNVVRQLTQSGFHNITVVDDDRVEPHNVLPQSFALTDISKTKVAALHDDIQSRLDVEINVQERRLVEPELLDQTFIISAVDNMTARHLLWESFKASPKAKCFIDPRMGGLFGEMFFVPKADPKNFPTYESTLYPDGEVSDIPCTERATPFCGNVMAGYMVAYIVACLRGLAGENFQHVNHRLFDPMVSTWVVQH